VKVMAEQHGGKRTPKNPAPVSGPGKLSRRTDGGPAQVNAQMTGMGYGENKDFMEIQKGASMAAAPRSKGPSKAPQGGPMGAMGGGNPLFSETQRPDEPVTAGANFGPGAGASSNPIKSVDEMADMDRKVISQYLPSMMSMVSRGDTPEGFNRFVRHLRNLG
jgi:hypothetical protein